jgi:hypothetical protein
MQTTGLEQLSATRVAIAFGDGCRCDRPACRSPEIHFSALQ